MPQNTLAGSGYIPSNVAHGLSGNWCLSENRVSNRDQVAEDAYQFAPPIRKWRFNLATWQQDSEQYIDAVFARTGPALGKSSVESRPESLPQIDLTGEPTAIPTPSASWPPVYNPARCPVELVDSATQTMILIRDRNSPEVAWARMLDPTNVNSIERSVPQVSLIWWPIGAKCGLASVNFQEQFVLARWPSIWQEARTGGTIAKMPEFIHTGWLTEKIRLPAGSATHSLRISFGSDFGEYFEVRDAFNRVLGAGRSDLSPWDFFYLDADGNRCELVLTGHIAPLLRNPFTSPARTAADREPITRSAAPIHPGQARLVHHELIIRGQAPDGPFNAINVRAQAPAGGAPALGTDPDSAPVRPLYNPYPPPQQPTAPNFAPSASASPTFRQAQFQTAPSPAPAPAGVLPPPGYVQPQPGFSAPPQNGPAQPSYLGPPGGAPQVVNPYPPTAPMQNFIYVDPQLGVDVNAAETQTGKLSLGVGINSDAGLVGNVVIDEQNFDISRWPESWEDIREGEAWRGAGQRLRVDVSPGVNVQNYSLSFQEPYLANTPVSFSERANYFQRIYDFWNESRTGNRVGLGYYFTPDLSGAIGIRTEEIRVYNPTVPTPLELEEALGHNFAYGVYETVSHDTRDSPFLPSTGHLFQVNLEQNWGDWHYPVETVDYRQYWTLAERADGSGKNTLGAGLKVGFSGPDTPIYDHFYAGGYSTLRGFYFRGASPLETATGSSTQVQVGGDFELLGTVEYLFPITPDDVIRGTFFVDYGTVESNVEMRWQDFRISPGFGLRIAIPQFGSAPIALDFAFPVKKMPGDKLEFFSFWVGVNR